MTFGSTVAGWLCLEARAPAKTGPRLLRERSRVSTSRLRQSVGPRCPTTSLESSVKKTGGQSKSRKWDSRPRRGPCPCLCHRRRLRRARPQGGRRPCPTSWKAGSRSPGRSPSQHRGQPGDVPPGSVAEGAAERPPTGSPEHSWTQHISRISAWGPVSTTCPSSRLFCVKTAHGFECA